MPLFQLFSFSHSRKSRSESLKPPLPYEPLRVTANTRIIKLRPGFGSQPIICDLEEISCNDGGGRYNALSYTWGDHKQTRLIVCNGHEVPTTPGLHSALRQLRHRDTPVALWIDQLCVDQRNIEERAQQVQLMNKIYSQAQKVVVWLGEDDSNSRTAMSLARKILVLDERNPDIALHRGNLESLGLPRWQSKDWKALGMLFERPWFTRVWIIQEVVVSGHAVVMCGQESLLWEELVRVVRRVQFTGRSISSGDIYELHRLPSECVTTMNAMREYQRQGMKISFLHLLIGCRHLAATDSRDKIFALLGLGDYDITPDYSKDQAEVNLELAVYHISQILPSGRWQYLDDGKKAGWLSDLLVCAGSSDSQRLESSLPSWVPDWNAPFERDGFGIREQEYQLAYCAGGDTLGKVQILNNELHLCGKPFDTITMAGTVQLHLKNGMWAKAHHEHISAWFAESNFVASHCPQPYPTGEPVNEVYKRTLIVGKTKDGGEASAAYIDIQYWTLAYFLRGGPACMDFGAFHEKNSQLLVDRATCRTLILTQRGYLGLAPWGTQVGDTVCVLQGVPLPMILRPSSSHFKLVGECYMHGIMEGELMVDRDIAVQDIVLT